MILTLRLRGAEDFEALREKVEEIPTLYTIDLVNLDNCKMNVCWRISGNMDAKFLKRYESYQRSLRALAEVRKRDLSDSFVLSGAGAKFCITFELAWKVMKEVLVQYYAMTNFITGSPREVLKAAFRAETRYLRWMEMLRVRNDLAHDYDEMVIKAHCKNIAGGYLDLFFGLEQHIDLLLEKERQSL